MKESEQKIEEQKREKITRQLVLMEAGLYVAGRPLDLKILAGIVGTRSKKKVKNRHKSLFFSNLETMLCLRSIYKCQERISIVVFLIM